MIIMMIGHQHSVVCLEISSEMNNGISETEHYGLFKMKFSRSHPLLNNYKEIEAQTRFVVWRRIGRIINNRNGNNNSNKHNLIGILSLLL